MGLANNALEFFGGVPRQIVCDNLRSGITRACFYEPLVNRTYADMARHYGTAVIPARPYKARDKAKVEVGVQVVLRWILARLRHQRFFSLAELNSAIHALQRRALYQQVDRPALQRLPPALSRSGVFGAFLQLLAETSKTAHVVQFFDSTVVRSHVSAAGAKGGRKIRHLAVRGVGSPRRSTSRPTLTACQRHHAT